MINIAGFVVNTNPKMLSTVIPALNDIEGVEVHAGEDVGKLVVTVEATGQNNPVECITDIQLVDGVVSAALVYHHMED